jgi:hypothetical protein
MKMLLIIASQVQTGNVFIGEICQRGLSYCVHVPEVAMLLIPTTNYQVVTVVSFVLCRTCHGGRCGPESAAQDLGGEGTNPTVHARHGIFRVHQATRNQTFNVDTAYYYLKGKGNSDNPLEGKDKDVVKSG